MSQIVNKQYVTVTIPKENVSLKSKLIVTFDKINISAENNSKKEIIKKTYSINVGDNNIILNRDDGTNYFKEFIIYEKKNKRVTYDFDAIIPVFDEFCNIDIQFEKKNKSVSAETPIAVVDGTVYHPFRVTYHTEEKETCLSCNLY